MDAVDYSGGQRNRRQLSRSSVQQPQPAESVLIEKDGDEGAIGGDRDLLYVPGDRSRQGAESPVGRAEVHPVQLVEVGVAIRHQVDALAVSGEPGVVDARWLSLRGELAPLSGGEIDQMQIRIARASMLHHQKLGAVGGRKRRWIPAPGKLR